MTTGPGLFDPEPAPLFIHAAHVQVTPREKPVDATTTVSYSVSDTLFGPARVFSTAEGIFRIDLLGEGAARAELTIPSSWEEFREPLHDLAIRFIGCRSWSGPVIPLSVHGTAFQFRVWELLLNIPYGERTTYGAIAAALGDKKLSRAVGAAVGSNPVAVIVPCHRVVAMNGKIGEFRWGGEMKRVLLNSEDLSVGGTNA